MSPQERDATIQYFSKCFLEKPCGGQTLMVLSVNNVHVTVFLVSLKAGGVALNLTEASRVYLMDSWWNPAVSSASILLARARLTCLPSDKVEYRE